MTPNPELGHSTPPAADESRIQWLESVLNAFQERVIATDQYGRVMYCNRSASLAYGLPIEGASGRLITELFPAVEAYPAVQELDPERSNHSWTREVDVNRHDGSRFTTLVSKYPLHDGRGALMGAVYVASDPATARVPADEERQIHKLAAVGRLAVEVAHDFNNILTSIEGFTELLLERLDPLGTLHADALEIRAATQRAVRLTRRLLAYNRKTVAESTTFSVSAVVASLEEMLRRLVRADIQLQLRYESSRGRISGDPMQLEQIVVNLLVNAVDAISNGGRILIGVEDVDVEEPAHGGTVPAGEYVVLTVSDTGCGMTEETASRIFEPFFTTKPIGQGTGIGLSTVRDAVEQFGGCITVFSRPGNGTTFRVFLPRAKSVSASDDHAAPAPGARTILLVEDDYSVRKFLRRGLEQAGYSIIDAAAPSEALFKLDTIAGCGIDLLLADIMLPEMSGAAFARQLRDRYPNVNVLLMSGYDLNDLAHMAGVSDITASLDTTILAKPFTIQQLLWNVQAILCTPGVQPRLE